MARRKTIIVPPLVTRVDQPGRIRARAALVPLTLRMIIFSFALPVPRFGICVDLRHEAIALETISFLVPDD
jgi:hypothetical protein